MTTGQKRKPAMLFISLPRSVRIGDTIACKINGEPVSVTWLDTSTLVIAPDHVRTIVDTRTDGARRHFTCSNAEGDEENVVVIG
jgi:hypothetical protein